MSLLGTRLDKFYWYNRRIPMSGGNTDSWDALDQGCRSCHQPYWAYALPKTEEFSYRVLGTTSMLACLTAEHEPAGMVRSGTDQRLGSEPFQLRQAHILEMIPLLPGFENLRNIVYLDTESYVWLGAEFFDGIERTESAFPLWRALAASSSGYRFELAGKFYFPTGCGQHTLRGAQRVPLHERRAKAVLSHPRTRPRRILPADRHRPPHRI